MTVKFNSISAIVFLLALFIAACQPAKEPGHSLPARLDSLLAAYPDFSGTILAAENGKPVFHKAFGYRDLVSKTPIDTSTIFELASVSKQFTGVAIMMLAEEGKLGYDDLLEKYVPGLPYPGITIRHLLHHTSGLPDYQKVMDEHWDKSKPAGNDDVIAYLKQYHPDRMFEPGEKYQYSNTGYVMLGSVIEKVINGDFTEFCRTRLFAPVKMSSTNLRAVEDRNSVSNYAWGHVYSKEMGRYVSADSLPSSNYVFWLGKREGPGRISSTTSDLLKWDRALYTETLVKKTSLDQAFAPATLNDGSLSNYGFGWELRTHPTLGRVVFHGGDNPGYKTVIVRYIDADKTFIVLCNAVHIAKFNALIAAIDQLMGK